MSTVNFLAFGETVCKEGRLSKRQRGRKESTSRGFFSKSPASLKFQERYFLLTNRRLIYRDKKNDTVIKGEFPVSRVEVVETMAYEVFHRENVIQVGDDDEVLYLVPSSAKECSEWVAALQKAALKNGNQMLEWYHHGIFGKNGKWTCCRGAGRSCMGCTQATKYSGMDGKKTQRLLQAEKIHEDALKRRQRGAVVSMLFTSDQLIERNAMRTTRSRSFDIQTLFSTIKDVTKKRSSSTSGDEDSGRGSSIPPSPGSLLLSHTTNDPHTTQECTEESPLTKEARPSPNRAPPTPTDERRSSGTSLEESGHSASSGEGHPLLSSSGEGHPLLSLSYSQLQKPTTSTQDSVAMTFQNGFTPLHSAIREGNIASVTQEIEGGADLELPTATSPPLRPLVLAFSYDHFQVMELLLTRGADPNGVEPQNHSTLLHLVASRGSTSVAALLLRHQADINAKTSKGDTPLHIAAREGHTEVVQLFLKSGCRVNEVNNKERTPLHEAAEAGHVAMVKLLLAGGGNPLLQEGDFDATPYTLAHKTQRKEVCGILQAYLSPHQLPYSLVATVDGAHPGPVETIAFCSANTLVSSGGDTQVTFWELSDGSLGNKANIPTGDTVLAVSHFGGRLAVGSSAVHVVDSSDTARTGGILALQMGDPRDPPLLLASFAPSGELIVAGTDDTSTEVQVWPRIKNTQSLPTEPLNRFDGGKGAPCCIYSLAVSPVATPPVLAVSVQPGTLFKAAGNKEIHLWNYSSGKHLRTLDVGHGGVNVSLSMSFSQDGRHLAVACVDVVSVWSVETGQVVRSIVPEASTGVLSVSFSPSGAHLVVGCERGLVKVYANSDFKPLFELQEQKGYITCLAYSENGEWLASGSSDGSLCLWRV